MFLRDHAKKALERLYTGPHEFLSRPADRVFELEVNGASRYDSVENFKLAHFLRDDIDHLDPLRNVSHPDIVNPFFGIDAVVRQIIPWPVYSDAIVRQPFFPLFNLPWFGIRTLLGGFRAHWIRYWIQNLEIQNGGANMVDQNCKFYVQAHNQCPTQPTSTRF